MDRIDWVILVAKVLIVFAFLMVAVIVTVWAERRTVAFMQQRIGPNRVGPFGILQTLADGLKLFFKEDIVPAGVDRAVYLAAPLAAVIPAFMSFAIVPVGNTFRIGHRVIEMQLADLNIGILFFLAMGSLMVYGVVLAGWSSGSTYPLFGAVRASAQMISYEIAMGLSVVAVVLAAGTLSTRGIVDAQAGTWFGFVPHWFAISQFPAFVVFLLAGIAESNRPPFDLPEAETELVAGYHLEYSGVRFMMFFLAEYLHVITTSAIATTLFLGGWRGPILPFARPVWPPLWFLAKVIVLVFVFVWARATLPRVRYDRLMAFGWKVLIPVSLVWVMATATLVALGPVVSRATLVAWTGLAAGALALWWLVRVTLAHRAGLRAARPGKEVARGGR